MQFHVVFSSVFLFDAPSFKISTNIFSNDHKILKPFRNLLGEGNVFFFFFVYKTANSSEF